MVRGMEKGRKREREKKEGNGNEVDRARRGEETEREGRGRGGKVGGRGRFSISVISVTQHPIRARIYCVVHLTNVIRTRDDCPPLI